MIRGKWKKVYWLERGKNEIIQFLRLDASRFSWNVSKRYVTALRIIELSFHASHPTGICSPVRVCPSPCERISARTYRPRLRTMHRWYTGYREVYIYIYITGAYSYLLPHPWRTICAVLPYPLSALTKLTLSSFSRGRGLVANPDSNRDPREFPWSFTRCATIVPRSNFLSFFFPVVIAKFFSYYFHFFKIFIWKKMWQSVSLIWRFEIVGCRLPADLSRKRDMIHRRKSLSPKNCTSTGIFVNYYI